MMPFNTAHENFNYGNHHSRHCVPFYIPSRMFFISSRVFQDCLVLLYMQNTFKGPQEGLLIKNPSQVVRQTGT